MEFKSVDILHCCFFGKSYYILLFFSCDATHSKSELQSTLWTMVKWTYRVFCKFILTLFTEHSVKPPKIDLGTPSKKKNRKFWGFYPKRREGVTSETQFLHTFNLGYFSEEGGGQNLNSQIYMPILLTKFHS